MWRINSLRDRINAKHLTDCKTWGRDVAPQRDGVGKGSGRGFNFRLHRRLIANKSAVRPDSEVIHHAIILVHYMTWNCGLYGRYSNKSAPVSLYDYLRLTIIILESDYTLCSNIGIEQELPAIISTEIQIRVKFSPTYNSLHLKPMTIYRPISSV